MPGLFKFPSAQGLTGSAPLARGIPRFQLGPLIGVKEVMAQLEGLKEDIPRQVVEITGRELDKLLAYAKSITPVDKGHLQKSGRIFKPRFRKDAVLTFQVAFGGIQVTVKGRTRLVDYAAEIHETHKTKSKFLEKAAQRYLPGLADRITAQVKVRV